MKQQEEQKHFHKKLMQELCTSASRMKASTTIVNSGNNQLHDRLISILILIPSQIKVNGRFMF